MDKNNQDMDDTTRKMYRALVGLGVMTKSIRENLSFIKGYHDEHGGFPMAAVRDVSLKMRDINGAPVLMATKGTVYTGDPMRTYDKASGMYITVYSTGYAEFVEYYNDGEKTTIGPVPFSSLIDKKTAGTMVAKCREQGIEPERFADAAYSITTALAQGLTWSAFALGQKFNA